jgi:nucleoid DNA-binding protein
VDGFLNAIRQALAEGNHIEIRGFGTFKVRNRRARVARNPRTGEPVRVEARAVPVFKPSKNFRARDSGRELPRVGLDLFPRFPVKRRIAAREGRRNDKRDSGFPVTR